MQESKESDLCRPSLTFGGAAIDRCGNASASLADSYSPVKNGDLEARKFWQENRGQTARRLEGEGFQNCDIHNPEVTPSPLALRDLKAIPR
jgi:hypothetical protein